MAFENQFKNRLFKWLTDQNQVVSQTILDGSCKNIEDYRERCGRLRALWDVSEEMASIDRRLNSPQEAEDAATPFDR